MVNRPKAIGTAAETALVRWLRVNGWPHAERRALTGSHDQGDVTGCPGLVWEAKAGDAADRASDAQVRAWLTETETERVNARADIGILVLRRRGKASPGDWWAVVDASVIAELMFAMQLERDPVTITGAPVRLLLSDLAPMLRVTGYGIPQPLEAS